MNSIFCSFSKYQKFSFLAAGCCVKNLQKNCFAQLGAAASASPALLPLARVPMLLEVLGNSIRNLFACSLYVWCIVLSTYFSGITQQEYNNYFTVDGMMVNIRAEHI